MKPFVLIALVACVTIVSSIPVGDESSKNLNELVRDKRGGWGYEPAYTSFYPSPQIHTQVFGPTKTIITAAHPPVTTVVVPQRVHTAVAYPATTHAESYVWQSGPDHSYFVHQRHSPRSYYYYQPSGTHILNTGPVVAWS